MAKNIIHFFTLFLISLALKGTVVQAQSERIIQEVNELSCDGKWLHYAYETVGDKEKHTSQVEVDLRSNRFGSPYIHVSLIDVGSGQDHGLERFVVKGSVNLEQLVKKAAQEGHWPRYTSVPVELPRVRFRGH